jgi:hypothetical protein
MTAGFQMVDNQSYLDEARAIINAASIFNFDLPTVIEFFYDHPSPPFSLSNEECLELARTTTIGYNQIQEYFNIK